MSDNIFSTAEMLVSGAWDSPLPPAMVVDMTSMADNASDPVLPPCPLIALGDPLHSFASNVDLFTESLDELHGILRRIRDNPETAAIVVQVLRALKGQETGHALVQESMAYGLLQGGTEHGSWLATRASVPAMAAGTVQLHREGGRLAIVMDRPAARNAIDRPMRDLLYDGFLMAALDHDVEAVTLRGTGKAFCVGADLSEFGTTRDPVRAHQIRMQTLPATAIVRCREKFSVHVQGACVGAGLEMAAFAGRLTAQPNAWFQLPELAMGLLPGAGGCVSVSQRIGRQRTAWMILSGKRISAQTALSWGLIDAIVDNGSADDGGADITG